ncbi:MAG: hypothetical protein IEMM0002_0727 [bacterium]|nr:MAG: hypothetical protein IEMM0002_0727 [bacterium]
MEIAARLTVRKKLFLFLGGITLLRLFTAGSFELSLDEGYYWLWSKHLAAGYYDHPPMVAYVVALTTLFSDAEFFIRLGPVAGALVSSLILYRLAVCLFDDERAGFYAVLIANITLVFTVGALIATPDAPLIPLYIAGMLLFLWAARSEPGKRKSYAVWIAAGAAAGGALLSKYTAAFFFPCAFLYLLVSPNCRLWLKRPEPYIGAVVSFLVFLPVIVWNARHDWVSLAFQASHGLSSVKGNPFELFAEFAGFQIVLYSIGIFFFLFAAGISLAGKLFIPSPSPSSGLDPRAGEAALFLFSFSFPILLFFVLNSFRTRIEGNWPILGFIPLMVQAGGMAATWKELSAQMRLFKFAAAIAVLMLIVLHVQIINPVIPHPQRYEISRRIYGWKFLAEKVDHARKKIDAAFLVSNRYQIASLITYYADPPINAYLPGKNGDLRFYFLPHPDGYKGKNALYLTEEGRDDSAKIAPLFERMEKTGTIDIVRKGELIRRFTLYLCYNYRGGLEKS